ncbi:uncharacterized protein ASCRUDRAFT_71017 [Ascoidea rubescens DSM 1968]|uniref:Uncharacterized protein n=1 Tax=Ascoidea rubescens DSM 1968 TaxID=1344418 RepID=A0A1D2VFW8_9ASCO|nr:hypothetical protein ASCRUDRAFT_71017 [Ascoidea rubescens DSM 1968]ODV60526.1 hypothetical protein ASCRUDRAFT_71017 [Ascoidea rubescens DSM 1968]
MSSSSLFAGQSKFASRFPLRCFSSWNSPIHCDPNDYNRIFHAIEKTNRIPPPNKLPQRRRALRKNRTKKVLVDTQVEAAFSGRKKNSSGSTRHYLAIHKLSVPQLFNKEIQSNPLHSNDINNPNGWNYINYDEYYNYDQIDIDKHNVCDEVNANNTQNVHIRKKTYNIDISNFGNQVNKNRKDLPNNIKYPMKILETDFNSLNEVFYANNYSTITDDLRLYYVINSFLFLFLSNLSADHCNSKHIETDIFNGFKLDYLSFSAVHKNSNTKNSIVNLKLNNTNNFLFNNHKSYFYSEYHLNKLQLIQLKLAFSIYNKNIQLDNDDNISNTNDIDYINNQALLILISTITKIFYSSNNNAVISDYLLVNLLNLLLINRLTNYADILLKIILQPRLYLIKNESNKKNSIITKISLSSSLNLSKNLILKNIIHSSIYLYKNISLFKSIINKLFNLNDINIKNYNNYINQVYVPRLISNSEIIYPCCLKDSKYKLDIIDLKPQSSLPYTNVNYNNLEIDTAKRYNLISNSTTLIKNDYLSEYAILYNFNPKSNQDISDNNNNNTILLKDIRKLIKSIAKKEFLLIDKKTIYVILRGLNAFCIPELFDFFLNNLIFNSFLIFNPQKIAENTIYMNERKKLIFNSELMISLNGVNDYTKEANLNRFKSFYYIQDIESLRALFSVNLIKIILKFCLHNKDILKFKWIFKTFENLYLVEYININYTKLIGEFETDPKKFGQKYPNFFSIHDIYLFEYYQMIYENDLKIKNDINKIDSNKEKWDTIDEIEKEVEINCVNSEILILFMKVAIELEQYYVIKIFQEKYLIRFKDLILFNSDKNINKHDEKLVKYWNDIEGFVMEKIDEETFKESNQIWKNWKFFKSN